ncbi:MAG: hypothetical protein PHD21_08295 [Flavobacteriales bacterium]|nr:hypothetical protein [Flavobacteriales bacterium]
MKSIKHLLLLAFLFAATNAFSQQMVTSGRILDSNGQPVKGAVIKTNKSKASTITDANGTFSIEHSAKDKSMRLFINDKSILTMPIGQNNDINLTPANDPSVTGYMKGDTYYPGSGDLSWETVITSHFTGVKYNRGDNTISINRFEVNSPATTSANVCKYYEVDGSNVPSLDVVELPSVYSIRIIKDMAESIIYGAEGQFGAVIIKTKGMQKTY